MEFAVITRALDSSNVPQSVGLALAKATFQMLASKQDSRIKAAYPWAGERGGILIVDVKSGEELQEVIGSLPFFGQIKTEIHALGTLQGTIKAIEAAEQRVAQMAPAGAR
jgi:muconolactone delta-isomerase